MVMNSYYEDTLYPLQDKVLAILRKANTPFYLTGGTALSRFYYRHRYSEDLDFFVNSQKNFLDEAERLVQNLNKLGIEITHRSDSFYSTFVQKKLKVDFVNDTGTYPKDFLSTPLYEKIDKPERILANKITSIVSRDEAKDVVDIWIITKNIKADWEKVFVDATSRAVGIFPPVVAQRLAQFPVELIENIKWVKGKKPLLNEFQKDIRTIVNNILKGH